MVAPLLPHVFDSAGSSGVVFGQTRVVVEAFLSFRCFVVLCVCFRFVGVPAALASKGLLFEFITYLTGLNSNPSGSSYLWVAARPSGVPGGGSERSGRYSGIRVQGSNVICNELITMAVPKKGTSTLLARPCRVLLGKHLVLCCRWLDLQQGPSVSFRRVLRLLLGARAVSVVVVSLVLRLGSFSACVSVWVPLRSVLACFFQLLCYLRVENGALVVLVEVLPEPVILLPLSAVFLSIGRLFELPSGDVFQIGSWHFWWRFSPKLLRVVLVVAAPSRCGASDRVSGHGAGQFVFLIVFRVSRLRWWDFVCPQDQEVGFVFSRPAGSARWWSGECHGCLAGYASVEVPVSFSGFPLACGRDSL
ncbi:hypothetical protein Taro_056305 [Colocasia esculenta]|uniref:Uncharacterized protein n=1 Tax=Colocasia esculenta TaxID=4460 RepID=A0A843XVX9_COLES|nr:hypothetical protein [Colocasia esculenta]